MEESGRHGREASDVTPVGSGDDGDDDATIAELTARITKQQVEFAELKESLIQVGAP